MSFFKHHIFEELSTKFSHLLYERTVDDRDLINKTLDELNNLNYRYPIIRNPTKAVLLINNCCTLIPPDDEELVPKCCILITSLVNMQKVVVEGKTLNISVDWILHTLRQNVNNSTVSLIALNALLNNHKDNVQLLIPKVLSVNGLFTRLTTKENQPEVILQSVKCLETLTEISNFKSHVNDEQLEFCINIFHSYLLNEESTLSNSDEICHCKIIISCINSIKNLVQCNQDYLNRDLGVLLSIAKSFMTYGIKGVPFCKPVKLMPTNLSIPDTLVNPVKQKRGGKIAKQRKQRISNIDKDSSNTNDLFGDEFCSHYSNINLSDNESAVSNVKYVTSDSDYSDSERGKTLKLDSIQIRLRQSALNLFYHLVNLTDKRTIFSYWSNFVPDGNPSFSNHTLTTCILKDPSAACRMSAVNVLLTLLISSKTYLSQAEYSEKTTSFTPFSVALGYILKELHRCLCLALNENSTAVLVQVLKCLAGLVQSTPYHRLSKGMIRKVVRNVKILVYHKSIGVQVAALIVIGCIFTLEPVIDETRKIFMKKYTINSESGASNNAGGDSLDNDIEYVNFSSDDDDDDVDIRGLQNDTEMPWILEMCLQNLGKDLPEYRENIVIVPLKAESLRVLCAMSRNYIDSLMGPYLIDIAKVLKRVLCEKGVDVYGAKTIDFIGQALSNYFANNTDDTKTISLEQGLKFWLHLIDDPLIRLLQNEKDASLRAIGCDCLASIGTDVFEHLPREKQILIITLLFTCTRDEHNNVIGAAVRGLGICVLYPSMREDSGFILDVAETIKRTYDNKSLNIRDKSSWSLANLNKALGLNRCDSNDTENIPSKLFLQLLNISTKLCYDHDRVKCNAARSIGPLLQLVDEEDIKMDEFKLAVENAVKALVQNCLQGAFMKVKWNSCYSFGKMLKNDVLFVNEYTWKESAYNTLIDLVKDHRNFKVRTNAAIALSSPTNRQVYGKFYYPVWESLMKALENSQNMDDLSEYKHRDNLVEQICLSLAHLATFLNLKDLNVLSDSLNLYADILKLHMHKVLKRTLSEKSNNINLASQHVLSLKPNNDKQRNVISLLNDIYENLI